MTDQSAPERPAELRAPGVRIAPSLLAADFSRLRDELQRIEAAGADMLHLDVMDGHFVPNISFGIPVIEKLRGVTRLFFDTHLMIQHPLKYADAFVKAGSDCVSFHVEAASPPQAVIERLRGLGVTVGISLNPRTPVAMLIEFIPQVDLVNVMTVEPGFGGQGFIRETLATFRAIRPLLRADQRLEADGGVNAATIADVVAAGADTLVAGTAVFRADDPAAALNDLRHRAAAALAGAGG